MVPACVMAKKGQTTGLANESAADGGSPVPASSTQPVLHPLSPTLGHSEGSESRSTTSHNQRGEAGSPGAHLHVVTLLLLHLGVDTQLLPGAQHTHPGPGKRESWGPRMTGQ